MASLVVEQLTVLHLPAVSFVVEAGELLVLGGPSGSGKSLLLRAMADLDPHQGDVIFAGQAQSTLSGPVWRQRVGLLPAESHWWLPTPREHLPAAKHWSAEDVGLPAEALDWEIRRLSSGERQRLALLRLLAHEPAALLLDEPTANLDAANGLLVESLVRRYASERQAPVVWVSHDDEQRRRIADRVLWLDGDGLREGEWR